MFFYFLWSTTAVDVVLLHLANKRRQLYEKALVARGHNIRLISVLESQARLVDNGSSSGVKTGVIVVIFRCICRDWILCASFDALTADCGSRNRRRYLIGREYGASVRARRSAILRRRAQEHQAGTLRNTCPFRLLAVFVVVRGC